MSILLATGLNKIETKLESSEIQRCYHRSVLLDVVKEINPDVVVLSPHIDGEEDLLNSIVIPLRKSGIRIIFLPGTPNMSDTRDWMKKLLSWGVYCYVFDPVTPEKILYRIENPGRIKDLPESFIEISQFPDEELPEIKMPEEKSIKRKIQEFIKRDSEKEPKRPTLIVPEKRKVKEQNEFKQLNMLSSQNDILKSPKKSTLIDLGGLATMRLQESYSEIWKSDWRLGLRAEPIKLPSGSFFYSQSRELGESNERDEGLLMDLLFHLSDDKKPLYVVDPGKYTEMISRAGIS